MSLTYYQERVLSSIHYHLNTLKKTPSVMDVANIISDGTYSMSTYESVARAVRELEAQGFVSAMRPGREKFLTITERGEKERQLIGVVYSLIRTSLLCVKCKAAAENEPKGEAQ